MARVTKYSNDKFTRYVQIGIGIALISFSLLSLHNSLFDRQPTNFNDVISFYLIPFGILWAGIILILGKEVPFPIKIGGS